MEKTVEGECTKEIEGYEYKSEVIEKMGSGPAHKTSSHKGGTEMERPRSQSSSPQVFKGL
jgi:hypothetical protein